MAAKTCRMRSGKHEHIHSDVMENILTHLPVKSLLRFRTVQKSWNSLITTNPEFKAKHYKVRLQSHISGRTDVLLVINKDEDHCIDFIESWDSSTNTLQTCHVSPPPLRTFNKPRRTYFSFITVANGIVLLNVSYSYWEPKQDREYLCLLWNPATRKFMYLPPLRLHPREYLQSQAFGFEHQSQHFKVVGVMGWNRDYDEEEEEEDVVFVQVYSSKTGGLWNLIRTKFYFLPQRKVSLKGFCQKGGYLDGKFYWLGEEQTAGEIFPALDIIEFDFETYSFKVTPVPESINIINREAKYVTVDLIVYKETLTLLTSNLVLGRKVCDIWSMVGEDDHGVLIWEKKSWLSLDGLLVEEHLGRPRTLMTLQNGKQGIVFGSPGVVDQVALLQALQQPAYNRLPERELELLDTSNGEISAYPSVEVRQYWRLLRVTNYVESLFCIEADTNTASNDDRVDNMTFHQVLNKINKLLFFILFLIGLIYIAEHHILVAIIKH